MFLKLHIREATGSPKQHRMAFFGVDVSKTDFKAYVMFGVGGSVPEERIKELHDIIEQKMAKI